MHFRLSGCHELLGNGSENVDIDSEHELTSSPRYCKFVSGFGKPEIASIFADSVPERIGRKIPANCQLKQKSNSPHYWRNRHADNEACKERNPVKLFTSPFELPKNSREGWKRQSIFDRGVASAPMLLSCDWLNWRLIYSMLMPNPTTPRPFASPCCFSQQFFVALFMPKGTLRRGRWLCHPPRRRYATAKSVFLLGTQCETLKNLWGSNEYEWDLKGFWGFSPPSRPKLNCVNSYLWKFPSVFTGVKMSKAWFHLGKEPLYFFRLMLECFDVLTTV